MRVSLGASRPALLAVRLRRGLGKLSETGRFARAFGAIEQVFVLCSLLKMEFSVRKPLPVVETRIEVARSAFRARAEDMLARDSEAELKKSSPALRALVFEMKGSSRGEG